MKFFVPHAKGNEQEQRVYDAIKTFAGETLGWDVSDRKIFSIRYKHDGKDYYAEVGQTEKVEGEEVVAILESNTYLVCTTNRGVARGMPILVGKEEAYIIKDFDAS